MTDKIMEMIEHLSETNKSYSSAVKDANAALNAILANAEHDDYKITKLEKRIAALEEPKRKWWCFYIW